MSSNGNEAIVGYEAGCAKCDFHGESETWEGIKALALGHIHETWQPIVYLNTKIGATHHLVNVFSITNGGKRFPEVVK